MSFTGEMHYRIYALKQKSPQKENPKNKNYQIFSKLPSFFTIFFGACESKWFFGVGKQNKNEEYKKALDFFRTKLNEVAVFNSNLAYSTRLFTEHSTTKQEKINILRRFDSVESLKESKNLYQSIKRELDGKGTQPVVTESIQRKVTKTPQSGSATNLIESKTYENPQFMRIKDLMTKIN